MVPCYLGLLLLGVIIAYIYGGTIASPGEFSIFNNYGNDVNCDLCGAMGVFHLAATMRMDPSFPLNFLNNENLPRKKKALFKIKEIGDSTTFL
ncbi:MAG: hypothetical protein ACTSPD_21330 [Promethearchaeota archaeon]